VDLSPNLVHLYSELGPAGEKEGTIEYLPRRSRLYFVPPTHYQVTLRALRFQSLEALHPRDHKDAMGHLPDLLRQNNPRFGSIPCNWRSIILAWCSRNSASQFDEGSISLSLQRKDSQSTSDELSGLSLLGIWLSFLVSSDKSGGLMSLKSSQS